MRALRDGRRTLQYAFPSAAVPTLMALPTRSPTYRSYLLRFWHEPAATHEHSAWRFMLEDPHTGERQGFADIDILIGHLHQLMNQTDTPQDAQYNSQTDPTPAQNNVTEPQLRATDESTEGQEP